jgi:hypothetical protein
MLALWGCMTEKEIHHDQQLVQDQAQPKTSTAPVNNVGGIDSGGGNGFKGKPLESYKISLSDLPGYNQVIERIRKLEPAFPMLAGELYHIAKERSWYVIPGSLDVLPSERIGIAFQSEQMALQNLNEIWMDGLLLQKMEVKDEAGLILHEMVMGLFIYHFQDGLDLCLASISMDDLKLQLDQQTAVTDADKAMVEKENEDYKKNRELCYTKHGGIGGALVPSPLNPAAGKQLQISKEDYENIRHLVEKLTEGPIENLDVSELKAWMRAKNFPILDRGV